MDFYTIVLKSDYQTLLGGAFVRPFDVGLP